MRSLAAVLVAGLAAVSVRADDGLWFFADFDSPPQLDGDALTASLPSGGEVDGRFGRGYAFVSDKARCEDRFWVVRDTARLKSFPRERGTFACWFRSPKECLDKGPMPGFGYCGFWQFQWTWRGDSFSAGGTTAKVPKFVRSTDWRHFAATWNADRLVLYLDGRPVAEKEKPARIDMESVPRRALRIGAGYDGSPAANVEMDEIAIYRRDLSAADVRDLASAKSGLLSGRTTVVAEHIDFPVFWHGQENAALRTRFHSTDAVACSLTAELDGTRLFERPFKIRRGVTNLDVPIDVKSLKAGSHPWRLRLTAGGRTAWEKDGTLTIRPRRDRNEFKFLSWGGWTPVPHDYLEQVGINTLNVDDASAVALREAVENGFFVNVRYENNRRYGWASKELEPAAIREATVRDLGRLGGLHVWTSTLVNSEIYGSAYPQSATNQPKFLAWAKKELGFAPDFRYRNAPIEVNPKTAGGLPKGVIRRGSCPQLDTLRWVMARGMAPYRVASATAEAIHGLDPSNDIWSEPSFEGIVDGLDLLADWHYQYSSVGTLCELRDHYGLCRGYGKPYMPTLSGGYCHGYRRPVRIGGKTRKSADPAANAATESADEVAVKAWLSIAAVPAHALSFFLLDAWSEGEKDGTAEPGTGAAFGRMWRERLMPAAELLRDLPNERAPVALVRPTECRFTCGLAWGQVHYLAQLGEALSAMPVPFDVVYDRELEADALKAYRYAILPMARAIYDDHVARLEAAAKAGCRIVTDAYAAKTFSGGVHLEKFDYPYHPKDWHTIGERFTDWYRTVLPDLRKDLTARSDGDGTNVFTFVKSSGGVRYVTVVNDLRSDRKGFLNGCVTNDWYRPYGAPQRIVTHLNVPKGSAVYEYNAKGRSIVQAKDCSIVADYAAAEGKVFCVYPKPLEKLLMDRKDGSVRIALVDGDGRPAPGRQVVSVDVRDAAGRPCEECGRYVMEGGRVKVPLYSEGSLRISVRELTTGLKGSLSL